MNPIKLGIARDAAFAFYYPGDLEALRAAGAELVPIDTLHDKKLPEVDALLIGGGFPEVFMTQLEANASLRHQIRLAIETEVSALRDDVGAFLTADVQPHLTEDPATAHLILRLAQEMLAQAARLDEPSHLSVGHSSETAIALTMQAIEVGDVLRIDLNELALAETGSAVVDLTSSADGVHTITLTSR